ncbi:MAG: hypothetical protein MI919_33995, partial [Holophagales bacterium]|nr:hypothetical protein [Holophagales bacterium]
MVTPIWSPSPERVADANMSRFLERISAEVDSVDDYPSLYRWSVEEPGAFWTEVWDFCGIRASEAPEAAVVDPDRMPGASWFPGARINFAENLLRFRDDHPALVAWTEQGRRSSLTYSGLYAEVSRLVAALRELGIGPGDRVAGFLP